MTSWSARPAEIARLLNPAFCALVLRAAVRGYTSEDKAGMPFVLSFVVLPLALHRPSRMALPKTVARRLAFWISDEQQLRIGLSDRARALVPFTKEALIFGLRDKLFATEHSQLRPVRRRIKVPWPTDSDPSECMNAAHTLGRLFARAGDPGTVLANFGIAP